MPAVAHIGDFISHEPPIPQGAVIGGSPDVFAQGRAVARVGDYAMCEEHGLVQIASGSATVYANGQRVAHNGSTCTCGAVVIAYGTVYVDEG